MFGMIWDQDNNSMLLRSTYQLFDGAWKTGWLAIWAHGGTGY